MPRIAIPAAVRRPTVIASRSRLAHRTRAGAWPLAMLAALAACVTPARAQFEEPDTIPRFAVGAFVDMSFRGARGVTQVGTEVSFTGGPAFGVRMECRISETQTIALRASYARPKEERYETTQSRVITLASFDELQVAAELLFRLKPSVPGYFVVGAGLRYVDPVTEVDDPFITLTRIDSFIERLAVVGTGVELNSTRNQALRLDFRLYLVAPADQPRYSTKSVARDYALGLGYMYRI